MTLFNGVLKKVWDVAKIAVVLGMLGTIGSWYLVYAKTTATLGASVSTNTADIAELKDDLKCQEKANRERDVMLIRLDEFYKLAAPRTYDLAAQRADSIIRAREDSLNAIKAETTHH